MKRRNLLSLARLALALGVLPHTVTAINYPWTGGGTDDFWSTGANWGGTPPASAATNSLLFSGTGRPNNTNDLAALTNGWVHFANGGFTLDGNLLTLNPSGAGVITNAVGTNTIALPLNIAPTSKWWSIAPNSELRLTGALTNSSPSGTSTGWLFLTNGGTLRLLGDARTVRGMDLFQGTVIVDGGFVDASSDGIRFKVPTGQTVSTLITNDGTWRIGGGGNFRMGDTGSAAGSLSQLTVASGTLELYGANTVLFVSDRAGAPAVVTQNGGLVWGSAGAGNTLTFANTASGSDGTYHLNGGELRIAQVRQANANVANVTFNFNGGTLKPTTSSTTFFQGLATANVQNGGALIDTTNFNITIAQNLNGAGGGGLTKLGSGALTLSGTNTYTGATVVSAGMLLVNGPLQGTGAVQVNSGTLGGSGTVAGAVTVQSGAALAPGVSVGTLTLQSHLTLAGSLLVEVDKSLAATNDFVQAGGQLTNAGGATVVITNLGPVFAVGDSFKLFNKAMSNGAALVISPAAPGAGMAWTNKLAVDGSLGIISAPIVATPADLIGLALSAGTLTPAFSSNLLNYTAGAPYSNSTVVLTPTAANPAATIRVICDGVTNVVTSGSPSAPVALKVGANVINVHVTAPDDSITKDYFVTFTRIPPNVVVVLVDDLGFSDVGCYGGEIPTPNLDNLAAGGLRFRNFYNTARCSTTRVSLLTGLYSHQAASDPGQSLPNLRNDNNVTIAELLGTNGYRTYMAGKWHLGGGALAPEARGFQHVWRFSSATAHSANNWNTNAYLLASQNNEVTNRIYPAGTFYQADAIGDFSEDFMTHHQAQGDQKPFFLYMAFGAPHFPIQAPKAWVDTNAPVYAAGWDSVRHQRYTNMLARGVIDSRHPLSPRGGTAPHGSEPVEEIPAWDTLGADRQADLARRMAIYAAMIQKLDHNVGRVVERLRQEGQLDNTVIFFMSDNGGNHEGGRFGQTGGTANAAPLTGTALDNMGLSGQPDIHIGGGWANVNNTPFRISKHFNHEGGIRSPLIIHWPQGGVRTNEWSEQRGHLMDIMATIVDVTGVSYPTQFQSHAVLPLEGLSLKPQFTATNTVARTLGFEHESNRAWFNGDLKLVTKNFAPYDGSSTAHELELYDLNTDPVELTNLAPANPTLTIQMITNWNAWAARVGVPAARFITIPTNAPPSDPAPHAGDVFLDTFARPNATDVDVSAAGMSGSHVPPLGVDATYYEGYEGSGAATSIQTVNGALQMAVGAGMSENGLMHNFIGQDIIDAGGFSVELNVREINTDISDAANRYVGFGVGLSQAEAATGWDIGAALTGGAVAFRGRTGGNTGVTDFFVELDFNGNIKVWNNGTLLNTTSVGANTGTLTARFELDGFTTNDTVTVTVFFNGQLVDINAADTNSVSRTFTWDRDDSNYIGLSARAVNFTRMDNLAVRRLPLTAGLAIGYALQHGLSGSETAPDADPDGDGVKNLGEWAFGGDPAAPDPLAAKLQGELLTPARDFQFEFQRLADAASYGLQYRYLVSTNLLVWTETTPALVGVMPSGSNPGYEIATLQLPAAAIAGEDKLFLRVQAGPAN